MKKLSKDHLKRREEIASKLDAVASDLEDAINKYNQKMQEAWGDIEKEVTSYNEIVGEANELRSELYADAESYMSEKSDKWQEGDAGSAYSDWHAAFAEELEEIELDTPDEIELPDLKSGEEFTNETPEEPS